MLAILAWSSQCLLPGYPLLEARLDATCSGLAPYVRGKRPESHLMRALGWFGEADLKEAEARTFVGRGGAIDVHSMPARGVFQIFG